MNSGQKRPKPKTLDLKKLIDLNNRDQINMNFQGLVELSFEGVAIFDKLNITFANLQLLEMFGYQNKEDMENHSLLEFVIPEYHDIIKNIQVLNDKISSKPEKYEFKARRKDGSHFDAEITLIVAIFQEEISVQGIIRNITRLKEAQEALRQSEEKLQSIVSSMDDQIFVFDRDGIIIDYYKPSASIPFSFEPGIVVNKSYADIFPVHIVKDFQKAFETIIKDGMVKQFDFPLKNNGKEYTWYSAKLSTRHDKEGSVEGFTVVVRDISDQKLAEKVLVVANEKLEERVAERTSELIILNQQLKDENKERKLAQTRLKSSQQMLNSILRSIPDVIYRLDQNGNITFINEAVRKYGYNPEELLGKSILKMMHLEDRKTLKENILERRTGTRRSKNIEVRLLNFGQEDSAKKLDLYIKPIFLLNSEGIYNTEKPKSNSFIGTQGIARDITERKQLDETIIKSEERYRSIVENAHDLIFVTNSRGRFIVVNPRWMETLEFELKDIKKLLLKDIIHPDSRDMFEQYTQDLRKGKSINDFELKLISKNGQDIFVEGNITPQPNDKGQYGYQGLFRDITDKKRAEEEKQALESQLNHSQKMHSIGLLAGGIAHDFNNLLTAIKGNIEIANLKTCSDKPINSEINEIQMATDRAANLTRQLLAFSRKQTLQLKVIDINQLINGLEKMLTRMIQEDIELKLDLEDNPWMIRADFGQIEQIIVNLVVNARDAIGREGTIIIRTKKYRIDENSKYYPQINPGDYMHFRVEDNGSGMSPEIQDKVFDPFFTTKERDRGTGLGLSTVYGIVDQSKGNVILESEEGKGTSIKIFLPRVHQLPEEAEEKVRSVEASKGNETILLVEDDPGVRNLAFNILDSNGYKVIVATSGKEALKCTESLTEEVDLVVSDIVMPKMNGPEFVSKLREKWPNVKVLYMSGYSDGNLLNNEVLGPGVPYLQKPFGNDDLTKKVRNIIDRG